MCKKFSGEQKEKLRSALRAMEPGEEKTMKYDPKETNLSTLRVTAYSLGVDMGRKYSVSKKDKVVIIQRIL